MTKVMNSVEIRVLGQMRSGNHAIIAWLHSLYPKKSICFLNNVQHGDFDPFENYMQMELTGMDECSEAEILRNRARDVLIYSYEDRNCLAESNLDLVSSVYDERFEARREEYVGASARRFDIVIVRDPFNCLASRITLLRKRGALGGLANMSLIRDNWKAVARKAIDLEKTGRRDQITINYNRWVFDDVYREHLSKLLMAQSAGTVPTNPPEYGGGSSFIEPLTFGDLFRKRRKLLSIKRWLRFNEYLRRLIPRLRINKGDLLTRWTMLSGDDEYRELFRDPDVLSLSEQLFGEIPGTREFVRNVCGSTHTSA